jgi:type I protein arginine methyltransferase
MYNLRGYGEMIADRLRTGAYLHALRKAVKPGFVVLEIGTGAGAFAILACQLGAKRVYAIESSEMIQVARENAVANNWSDRIHFFEDPSMRVILPERADVIFSDLRGALPLLGQHIPSIVDARKRFLAPGGILIPRRDTIHAAVVEVPKSYAQITNPWERNILHQVLAPARRLTVNNVHNVPVKPRELLTASRVWAKLDYLTIENADVSGELNWTVKRTGTGHGILTWFDAKLVKGIGFSTAPGGPKNVYGALFFPWVHPVELRRGEKVRARLEAKLVNGDYVWRWTTEMKSPGAKKKTGAHFDQSTLAGAVVSLAQLHKSASDHVPCLSEAGIVDRRVLELMDGHATLEEIARRLADEFPERFARWQDALACAALVSQKYSR